MTENAPAGKSDLGVRFGSAIVMVVVAISALVLGGLWLDAFIFCVALAVFAEFSSLVFKITVSFGLRAAALGAGLVYIGVAAFMLIQSDGNQVITLIGSVIAVDVFAYFAGRGIGGPKIAPSISPAKTWSGLVGGGIGAAIFIGLFSQVYATPVCEWYYDLVDSFDPAKLPGALFFDDRCHIWTPSFDLDLAWQSLAGGLLVAIVAQAGDFLESWLKRKAGVKDSGRLIPGHGGVFDRTDGMIAVAFVSGLVFVVFQLLK